MKKLKDFYKSHRVGASVGKTLLWIWVREDLPQMKGDLGVDLAGGSMLTKRFFSTKKYISVDIDKKKLDLGRGRNLDAGTLNIKIQDFLKDEKKAAPDVLVCLQTMGTNKFFEHEETVDTVDAMCKSLKAGGGMVFNVGSKSVDLNAIEIRLSALLAGKFKSVKIKHYGAMHITQEKRLPGPVILILAYSMNAFPPLRTLFGFKRKKIYYCCNGKLDVDSSRAES